jgi:hypothetical protein
MDIQQLLHPPDSSDIAPCDFSLFGYLKMKLEGIFFDASVALFAEFEEILGNISIIEWVKIFDEWKDGLKRSIDAEGEYLSNDSLDLDLLFTTKKSSRARGLTARTRLCSSEIHGRAAVYGADSESAA